MGLRQYAGALLMLVRRGDPPCLVIRFWSMEGAERGLNQVQFLKNLSIMGGLLLLAVAGPGRYSLGLT